MKFRTILGATLVTLLAFVEAVIVWFSASTVYARLSIDIQGVIVSRTELTEPLHGNEFTEYYIQQADGAPLVYQAQATDYALSRDMPAGAFVSKLKWRLDYSIGGKEVDDFPKVYYSVIGLFGLLLAGGSIWFSIDFMLKTRRKPGVGETPANAAQSQRKI
jgi:hypothetical protein